MTENTKPARPDLFAVLAGELPDLRKHGERLMARASRLPDAGAQGQAMRAGADLLRLADQADKILRDEATYYATPLDEIEKFVAETRRITRQLVPVLRKQSPN